jgi:nucleoside-diphosphate-sugar epimerase/phosphohistidine swiveling domain-containing protein
MRVVVTGASGGIGSCIVAELLRRGHDVHGLSRGPHSLSAPSYRHTRADVRDAEALVRLMADGGGPADAVVHAAWSTHRNRDADSYAVNVGGTRAVLDAAERAGISRLVAMSSAMAYGAHADNPGRLVESDPLRPNITDRYSLHTARAEELITNSGVNALLVRAANVMGRESVGVIQRRFAAPFTLGVKGGRNIVQFIHPDDLGRFVGDAVEHPGWTGPVNLAAPDATAVREVAAILGKRYVECDRRLLAAVLGFGWNRRPFSIEPGAIESMMYCPVIDTTRLRDLGFVPAWTASECVTDFRRANRGHVYLGSTRVAVPWRSPWTRVPSPARDRPQRRPANDDGAGGEFDTDIDPAWSAYTAANTAEAFPGPMTPLSLELSLEAGRTTGALSADLLQMKGEVRRALIEEQTGSFAHTVYLNMSVLLATTPILPGAEPAAWENLLFGVGSTAEVSKADEIGPWGMAWRLPRMVAVIAGAASETRRMDREARRQQRDAAYYAGLTDEQLQCQLRCVRDEVVNAWAAAGLASLAVVPIVAIIEKQAGKRFATQFRGGTEGLVSAGLIRGAHELGELACADASIVAILAEADPGVALNRLDAEHPRFAARLHEVIAEYGHRGPGETELINPVFADSPARLLDVVLKLTRTAERTVQPMPPVGPKLRLLARLGAGFQQSRERARDAAVRHTHCYRLITREIGSRLAHNGVIQHPDDVFYLIRDELVHPPADVRRRVTRRRSEKARLEKYRPPMNFVERWELRGEDLTEAAPGESLSGIPVSAGIAKGRVRVLTADLTSELQPGEVLVTEFTDIGWTPFFAYAAAVVVDTGAEMSHAAVVAREFGIPCVVGSIVGSRVLRTGHLVEVDGSSGRVTRVE